MSKPVRPPSHLPSPGEAKRGVEGYLTYLLRQANAAVRLAMERELADLGVTPPQFSALTMLAAYGELSNAELARLTLQTPQTVNVIIGNLERRGAVSKRPDEIHGRILRLAITAEGNRLVGKCRVRADRIEALVHEHLKPASERAVREWLVALSRALPREA
jgi:DNA-binding MarR family transcriptional regulator